MTKYLAKFLFLSLGTLFSFLFVYEVRADESQKQIILLITVDSLRQDFLGAYNPGKKISPNLDKLAKKSFQFSDAYSPSSWTKPAMASMLTSSYLSQHGVGYLSSFSLNQKNHPQKNHLSNYKKLLEKIAGTKFEDEKFKLLESRAKKIPKSFHFLPELLKDYQKIGLIGNPSLLQQDGFDRGWDEFKYLMEDPSLAKTSKYGFLKSSTPTINELILDSIDKNKSNNIFIWAHYNDVHYPYGRTGKLSEDVYERHKDILSENSKPVPPLELFEKAKYDLKVREVLVELYEVGIRQFDQDMGDLFAGLEKRKVFDKALIIVTADHGEEFFEHAEFKHGNNLYNQTISIPFLIKTPGQNSHFVVSNPVSLTDIAPTILDFTNTKSPKEFVGTSLMPILRNEKTAPRPVFSEHAFTNVQDLSAVIDKNLKMIVNLQTGEKRVFDISKDPQEQKPFTGELADIYSRRLGKLLEGNIPNIPLGVLLYQQDLKEDLSDVEVDPAEYQKTLDQLRALGYM